MKSIGHWIDLCCVSFGCIDVADLQSIWHPQLDPEYTSPSRQDLPFHRPLTFSSYLQESPYLGRLLHLPSKNRKKIVVTWGYCVVSTTPSFFRLKIFQRYIFVHEVRSLCCRRYWTLINYVFLFGSLNSDCHGIRYTTIP